MRIEERLELVKEKVQTEDFLKRRGTVGEIAFYIFDYPPEKEMMIRETISRLKSNLEKKSIHVLDIDLYNLCLEILDEKISIEKVIDFEKNKGSKELFHKLEPTLKPEIIRDVIKVKMQERSLDLLFLTGVGKVWPMVRSHEILNTLQTVVNQVPMIMFYPGTWIRNELSLFDKFMDNNYYRAFRLINGDLKEEVMK